VLIEMPGSSMCTTTSWRLATWRMREVVALLKNLHERMHSGEGVG
jgi:hypothetical protein